MKRAFAIAAFLLVAGAARAHRIDELLQSAFFEIHPDRVEVQLDIGPGAAVAEEFILAADTNRDGQIDATESTAAAEKVGALLRLDLDGKTLELRLVEAQFPPLDFLRAGDAVHALVFAAEFPELAPGDHTLHFENTNRPAHGIWLAHALYPTSKTIAILSQDRSEDQSCTTIGFRVTAPIQAVPTVAPSSLARPELARGAVAAGIVLALLAGGWAPRYFARRN